MSSLLNFGLFKTASEKKWNLKDEAKFQAANAAAIFGMLPAVGYAPGLAYTKFGKNDVLTVAKLMRNARDKGLVDSTKIFSHKAITSNKAGLAPVVIKDKTPRLGHYVVAGDNARWKPGVIAHELGHAESVGKKMTEIYSKTKSNKTPWILGNSRKAKRVGDIATLINTAGHGFMSDTQMNTIAGLSTAYRIPVLAEEAKASWNGYKLLRNAGKGRLGALVAFAGLPTYLAGTFKPYIPALLSKYMDNK